MPNRASDDHPMGQRIPNGQLTLTHSSCFDKHPEATTSHSLTRKITNSTITYQTHEENIVHVGERHKPKAFNSHRRNFILFSTDIPTLHSLRLSLFKKFHYFIKITREIEPEEKESTKNYQQKALKSQKKNLILLNLRSLVLLHQPRLPLLFILLFYQSRERKKLKKKKERSSYTNILQTNSVNVSQRRLSLFSFVLQSGREALPVNELWKRLSPFNPSSFLNQPSV